MKVGFSDVNLDISLIPLEPSQRRWFVKLEWRGLDVTCGKLCLYCVCCFHHWIRLGMAWILSCQGSLMLDHVFVPMSFFMRSFHVVVPLFMLFQNVNCDVEPFVSARLSIFFTCTRYVFYYLLFTSSSLR